MPAFVTPAVSILPWTRARQLGRCAVRKPRIRTPSAPSPASVPLFHPPARAALADNSAKSAGGKQDDGDDEAFSAENPAYGMVMPDLSADDQTYVKSARNGKEFMRRMTEVARKIERKRHEETDRLGRQTPDDYINNLSRRTREGTLVDAASIGQQQKQQQQQQQPPPAAPSPPSARAPVTPPDDEERRLEEKIQQLNKEIEEARAAAPEVAQVEQPAPTAEDIDAQIAELQRKIMEAAADDPIPKPLPNAEEPTSPEELAAAAREIGELQEQIRSEIGLDDQQQQQQQQQMETPTAATTTESSSTKPSADNPDVVDKQIDYLERYIERLHREALEEGDAEKFAEDSKESGSESLGPEVGTPEKMAALINELNEKVTRSPKADRRVADTPVTNATSSSATDAQSVPSSPASDSSDGPSIVGLETKPGELSAEEKRAAFLELRRRAMEARGESDDFGGGDGGGGFGLGGDPFNVTLPEKKRRGSDGDFFSERDQVRSDDDAAARVRHARMAEMQRQAAQEEALEAGFEEPFNVTLPEKKQQGFAQSDDDGDMPSGDEDEYDSFGPAAASKAELVEEIEGEVKEYVKAAREMLRQHESRLSILLAKLMTSGH